MPNFLPISSIFSRSDFKMALRISPIHSTLKTFNKYFHLFFESVKKSFYPKFDNLLILVSKTSFLDFSDVQHCYSIIHTFISTLMPICSISVHSSFTPEQHRLFNTLMFTHLRKLTETKSGNHLQCAFPVVLEYLLQLSIKARVRQTIIRSPTLIININKNKQ